MGDRIVSGAFLDPPGSIHYLGPDLAICGGAVASEPLPEEMGKASRGKRSKAAAESSDMEALERKVLLTELRARQARKAKEEYAPIRWEVMKERYLKLMEYISEGRGTMPDQLNNSRPAALTAASR